MTNRIIAGCITILVGVCFLTGMIVPSVALWTAKIGFLGVLLAMVYGVAITFLEEYNKGNA